MPVCLSASVRLTPTSSADVLVVVAVWRSGGPVGDVQSVLARPDLAHHVSGWPGPGGLGVVVEEGPPVGAAWLRRLPERDRGYGFVEAETAELSIGVVPKCRGRGIASRLLEALRRVGA